MMIGLGLRRAAMAVVIMAGFAGLAQADTPDEIIAARRAGYKHMGENFDAIKKAIDAGEDVAPLVPRVQEVVDWSKKGPTMFPDGTQTGGGTHALPAIWTDRAGFDKDAEALTTQSTKLLQLAQANDKAGFGDQYKATGGACGACHRAYRARLN